MRKDFVNLTVRERNVIAFYDERIRWTGEERRLKTEDRVFIEETTRRAGLRVKRYAAIRMENISRDLQRQGF